MTVDVLAWSALVVALLMGVAWIVSLLARDASIVDIVWGLAFVAVAWTARVVADGVAIRQDLLVATTTIWGLRLTGHLAARNLGKGEDPRYQAMRRRWGARFGLASLVTVFALQGALVLVVSLPLTLGQAATSPATLTGWAYAGTALWAIGIGFETLGDRQLTRFKADPANRGRVMDRGLWRYTRHPNYFGDACVWWGLGLVALETGWRGAVALVGPVVMTVLLLRVSGVALLERSIGERRPGYAEYAARTSAFVPRPPKR